MPLESFHKNKPGKDKSTGVGDVRSINVPEIQPKSESPSQRIFAALKQTPLYDPAIDRWRYSMMPDQELLEGELFIINQLLGIYTQGLFTPADLQEEFIVLKNNFFSERSGGFWYELHGSNERATLPAQFMGLMVEFILSPETAKAKFRSLKEDKYSSSEKIWRITSSGFLVKQYPTDYELYARWLEASMFPERAASLLTELKALDFYDQRKQRWRTTNDRSREATRIITSSLLLELLIESQYAPEVAYQRYQALKTSELYDQKFQQWNDEDTLYTAPEDIQRSTQTQLLGIILEHRFEELFPETPVLAASIEQMPATKNI